VLLHAASTWFLVGLIWTVQVVHYPLFALVGGDRFRTYAAAHRRRISAVLAAPWATQGITTVLLVWHRPAPAPLIVAAAVLTAVPVVVTVTVSIAAHTQLDAGFDAGAHRRLVSTNRIRTGAWTLHGVVAAALVVEVLATG
jgi:hypothetical protein